MFSNVILRKPSKSISKAITSVDLGEPDYELSLEQHSSYANALSECGLDVTLLHQLDDYSDACFVEDVALLTPKCAIMTRPGAVSRQGEVEYMTPVIRRFYRHVYQLDAPATLDAGDVLQVEKHFFIGLSERTNIDGAKELKEILQTYGYTASFVEFGDLLHLKSGVAYLGNNVLLINQSLTNHEAFQAYKHIVVETDEAYCANAIAINDMVIMPKGFPKTLAKLQAANFVVKILDMSEFEKADGGVSCLSLRF